MNVTVKEAIDASESLKKFMKLKHPVATSFKLSRILNVIRREVDLFDEKKNELIKRLGEKDNSGEMIRVTNENMKEYIDELNSLLEVEINIDVDQISENDLSPELEVEPELLSDISKIVFK